jgi:hypothetical protein
VILAVKIAQARIAGLTKVSPLEETNIASKMWSDRNWQDAEDPGQGRRTQLLGEFLNEFQEALCRKRLMVLRIRRRMAWLGGY